MFIAIVRNILLDGLHQKDSCHLPVNKYLTYYIAFYFIINTVEYAYIK